MRVQVYRNIKTKEPQLSIRCANSHLVLGHCQGIMLHDVKFIVQPSGLIRTRKDKQRNVHAWVAGEVLLVQDFTPYKERTVDYDYDLPYEPTTLMEHMRDSSSGSRITYNPYTHDHFCDAYGYPASNAVSTVVFSDGVVIAEMMA